MPNSTSEASSATRIVRSDACAAASMRCCGVSATSATPPGSFAVSRPRYSVAPTCTRAARPGARSSFPLPPATTRVPRTTTSRSPCSRPPASACNVSVFRGTETEIRPSRRQQYEATTCGHLVRLRIAKPTVVAYRGSAPAIGDLLAGQIDLLWDQVTNALPQIQAGTLHGIAITSPQRLEQLKDVPTTAELGMPEVSYSMWHGLYVAKGTPKETVDALNAALRAALAEPELLEKLKQLGTLPFPDNELTPEAHARLFAADLPRVATLIESSGIKASEAK